MPKALQLLEYELQQNSELDAEEYNMRAMPYRFVRLTGLYSCKVPYFFPKRSRAIDAPLPQFMVSGKWNFVLIGNQFSKLMYHRALGA